MRRERREERGGKKGGVGGDRVGKRRKEGGRGRGEGTPNNSALCEIMVSTTLHWVSMSVKTSALSLGLRSTLGPKHIAKSGSVQRSKRWEERKEKQEERGKKRNRGKKTILIIIVNKTTNNVNI